MNRTANDRSLSLIDHEDDQVGMPDPVTRTLSLERSHSMGKISSDHPLSPSKSTENLARRSSTAAAPPVNQNVPLCLPIIGTSITEDDPVPPTPPDSSPTERIPKKAEGEGASRNKATTVASPTKTSKHFTRAKGQVPEIKEEEEGKEEEMEEKEEEGGGLPVTTCSTYCRGASDGGGY